MVVLVYFTPVSIHVPPALSKKCLDCPDWAIIQDLGNEALRGGKCAIRHEAETCYRRISSTEHAGKFPRLTHFYPTPVHLDGIQLAMKLG